MWNAIAKNITSCFSPPSGGGGANGRRFDSASVNSEPLDKGLGHSFRYVSANTSKILESVPSPAKFYSISGASVSANTSTVLSVNLATSSGIRLPPSAFDSSTSFASYPLYPIPRYGPDRAFLSGPIDRGFLSGPLDPRARNVFSGPLINPKKPRPLSTQRLRRSFSNGRRLLRTISSKLIGRAVSVPTKIPPKETPKLEIHDVVGGGSSVDSGGGGGLQWAEGRAGEDRIHVVISEEHGWVFVGIYDGFNGPDATDYLLSHLYSNLQQELKGVLWEEADDASSSNEAVIKNKMNKINWKCDWEKENLDNERLKRSRSVNSASHGEVLESMNQALRKTEDEFFNAVDRAKDNPELSLMGSCVLAMLMKGENVYVMNVGDSRAVLGQKVGIEGNGNRRQELGRISEENFRDDGRSSSSFLPSLAALQLTIDHGTSKDEVLFYR